jgi:hypothetical protein
MSENASEKFGVLGYISPATGTARTVTSSIVDARMYESVVFIFQCGDVSSSSGKIVCTVYEGTKTTAVSTSVGKMTWTSSSTGDNNQFWILDVPNDVHTGAKYRYLKGRMVYSKGTGAGMSCAVLGFKPKYRPGHLNDIANVEEIKIAS